MILGFVTGLVTANAAEWYIHKHLLHEDAQRKESFFRFHYAIHHKTVYENEFQDEDYQKTILEMWNPHSQEAFSLAVSAIAVSPLLPVLPGFTLGIWASIANYYRVHRKSHEDPEWGYKYLPWHYDHHMARDQEKNWCVTFPLWDYVMGTRVPYKGTNLEKKDIDRKNRKSQKAQI
ncbi:MAG: sterol desaturase family protein [Chitinophagales bacterium]|nr:sterol desaturase family protein [Chitinophagales bacterium]MCZ2393116.1 sterol desaturase family protein [Chitinophagales bacterium]